ncbi:PspC domain-containing protein [bacterium]|nr:PspC domain-containing protein [bacterium]
MEDNGMKKCPYCAEMIRVEAIKCRYCGSMLSHKPSVAQADSNGGYWRRVSQGKKIAGVCTGLAQQFESPVLILPLRVLFVVTTLFYGFGLVLYIVLWLLMPPPLNVESPASDKGADSQAQQYATPATAYNHSAPPPVASYPGRSDSAAPEVVAPGRKEPKYKNPAAEKAPEESSSAGTIDLSQPGSDAEQEK